MKDIQRRKLHINAEPCLHMQFATETDHSPSKKNISIVFLLPTWFARRGITKHLCNPNNYANIIYFINPYHNIACLDMVIRSHNPFLWQPGLISQSTAIVSSGIWTWDLSDSILYLNLKYQCLRPLSHHGWITVYFHVFSDPDRPDHPRKQVTRWVWQTLCPKRCTS